MQNNVLANLSLRQLKRALAIRERLDRLQKELGGIIGGHSPTARTPVPSRRGRFSAATRAKLSAATKARWAKIKGAKRSTFGLRTVARAHRRAGVRAKRPSPSGSLKERIIRSLKAAGESGVSVKDMAAKLGTSYGNISVWFHTTAKGVKEIKKVAPGRFAWVSS